MATKHDRAVLNSLFNPLLPIGECVYDEDIPPELKDEEISTPESEEAKKLELEGVKAAETGQIDRAIEVFTKAIDLAPNRASSYNNRAQAYRLNGNTRGALEDLNNAINVSQDKGKACCQAYCQRALIHRLQGNNDAARKDFESSARLGSEFAKSQLVQMNPYAALCNQMLGQMLSQLQKVKDVE
ncbi:tetratricopeptide repeat protein 36 homolog [Centruroides sculpturatus]|uniref:tetratricopeptide repeat protein 36 homolog n=1 Tax=Centruroides sculpturatus TaxID=218467 RepID=UPI000C6CB90D|nr:tetratricopeptide repeat protein 36 homolog [Centruroides sculpturatus]